MQNDILVFMLLFGVIVIIGQLFNKSTVPSSLLLVITGMILSLIPNFPAINLNSHLVLNVFLPILIYQISAFASWKDMRKNLRAIASLSVGHVIFIAFLVATVMHAVIPGLSWPLAFVLGAVVAPPDDVAIVSIAEKIRMPKRVVTILEGEGLLNDATALILFRFALIAAITHEFSAVTAVRDFIFIVVGETAYGLFLGYVTGEIRRRLININLHMIASFITPFLAYIPPEKLGGSGVLATAITGFVIGHRYSVKFTSEFRLFSRAIWPTFSYAIQSVLFLMVGLDLRFIWANIATLSYQNLLTYSVALIATVIIGRFIWVYVAVVYIPNIFSSIQKRQPYRWQYPFVVSWAGMRGAISLAAALAIPSLPLTIEGVDPRFLLVFLVFCVIAFTFVVQGLTLPWLLKILGLQRSGQREKYNDHIMELKARLEIIKHVLTWLKAYKEEVSDNMLQLHEVKLFIGEYQLSKKRLKERILKHTDDDVEHDEHSESHREMFLLAKIIEIEKEALMKMWEKEKINLGVRNKLLVQLDHRILHLPD